MDTQLTEHTTLEETKTETQDSTVHASTKQMSKKKNEDRRSKQKRKIDYDLDKEAQVVRGVLRYHAIPGGMLEFCYKRPYEGAPIEKYSMRDGEVYEIPLYIAKHLNKNCWYPVHKYALDDRGNPQQVIGKKVQTVSFESLEFVDDIDMTPTGNTNLVTVRSII